MRKIKLFLLTFVAMLGTVSAFAEYSVDFNTAIATSNHDFRVASNWKHIVHMYNDGYSDYYMSYSYGSDTGVDGTGALYADQQRAGDNYDYETAYDLLVTPVVSGQITIYAKKSTYASSPFVEFWTLDENGTARVEKVHEVTSFESDVWTAVTYNVETPQRIGIRAQYVYLDNFSAYNANIELEKSISIASAEPSATTGTIYWEQQANGKVLVQYTVTVTNNGETDLVQGEENYSVSIFNRKTNDVYATVAVPQNLAIGETSDPFVVSAELETSVWPNSYTYYSMDLRENLQGSVVQRAQSRYTVYEPKFVFRANGSTSSSSLSGSESWGTISESTTKSYEIYNSGTAPLTVKSVTLPQGFTSDDAPEGEFVVAKGESKVFNITQDASNKGAFTGTLEIVYVDANGADATYSLPFSATVIGANTWTADFNNTTSTAIYPEGSVAESGIRTDYNYNSATKIYDIFLESYTSSSYATSNNKFITPKLHATAGESLAFDVSRDSYGSNYNLKVYVSKDRKNWGEPVYSASYADLPTSWATQSITFSEEGDYYVAFAIYGVKVDNIIGLEKVDVAHDLYVKSVSWPDASVKSGASLSKPTVEILPLTPEAAENYTVKYVCGEDVLAEATSVALTASANSSKSFSFSWTPVVEQTTVYEGTKVVFEFTDGTKFETETFDLTVVNEPKFHFLNSVPTSKWYEPTDRSEAISFGKTNEAATQNFYVYNWGSAPLTVKAVNLPEGFTTSVETPFTVAPFNENALSESAQALDVTFSAATAGNYSGNLEVVYVDGNGNDASFVLPISGVKLDPSLFYANFDNATANSCNWPAGSVYQSGVSGSTSNYSAPYNYYITSSSSTNNLFVTPKLKADEGDKLLFDAKLYSTYWSEGKVVVYAAATRDEVINAEEGTTRVQLFSVSGQDEVNPMTTDYQTFEVNVPAGEWFIGFEISGRPSVDEIYGLKLADVAHDLQIASSDIPAEAMQNIAATASVNVRNLGLAAEDVVATVYVDGEAVAASEAVTLPVVNSLNDAGTKISVNFRYPKVGTFPVYIEVKAGDYSVATEPVDVTFAEEVASGDAIEVGTRTSADRNHGPVDWYNADGYSTRWTDIVYTAAELQAFGITKGAKITSIAFKGSGTSKSIKAKVTSWVGLSTGDITAGQADKENMTEVSVYDQDVAALIDFSNMVIDLSANPLVYDGVSDIRIYTETVGQGSGNWQNVTYAYDTNYMTSYNNSATPTATPLGYFSIAAEPSVLVGTVKSSKGEAVAATVTLVSNDGDNVQYTGETDAEGNFNINVVQASRTYDVTVSAEGFEPQVIEAVDLAKALNVVLSSPFVSEVVKFNISAAGWTSFSCAEAVELPEGVVAYVATTTQDNLASVKLVELGSNVVPANTGVLLAGEANSYEANTVETADVVVEENLLEAAVDGYTVTSVDEGFVYAFGKVQGVVGFVKAEAGYNVSANKAYLRVNEALAGKAFIALDGETTGINGVSVDALDGQATYNLNGQRVNGAQRGVVIRGGKKYIVK